MTGRYCANQLAWANNHRGWGSNHVDKCCLPRRVSLTCPSLAVTSESTDVGVRGSHSAVSWNTTDGVVVESWCGPASALNMTPVHVVYGRLNAMAYRNTILLPLVVPFMAQHGLRLFQQDNARPHVARLSTDFLRQQRVNVLPWPSLSPGQ